MHTWFLVIYLIATVTGFVLYISGKIQKYDYGNDLAWIFTLILVHKC